MVMLHLRLLDLPSHAPTGWLRFTWRPLGGAGRLRIHGSPPDPRAVQYFCFLTRHSSIIVLCGKNSIVLQLWFCLRRPFNFDLHLHDAPTCRPAHVVLNPDNKSSCSFPLKEHKHCLYGRPDALVLSPLISSLTWTRWCSCGEQMFRLCGAQMLRNPIRTRSCVCVCAHRRWKVKKKKSSISRIPARLWPFFSPFGTSCV